MSGAEHVASMSPDELIADLIKVAGMAADLWASTRLWSR